MDTRFCHNQLKLELHERNKSSKKATRRQETSKYTNGTTNNLPYHNLFDSTSPGHLVPAKGICTWKKTGSKHVQIPGMEDKGKSQFSTARSYLPFQLVFLGTTN